jgi:ParB/RepB/Spo0J family partition protein
VEVIEVDINLLKPAEYNPRAMNKKQAEDLRKSLETFDLVEPIVVNKHENRKNIIVGGHQRFYILKELGKKSVPVVYVNLPLEKEQELNLRLNKNLGDWDWEMLANLEEELLKETGFAEDELAKLKSFQISDLVESTEVDITRLDVITIDGPNSPKIKNRKGFYFDSIGDFDEVVKFFETNTEYKLDGRKLLELIKK